jgi:hypothetical protein
MSLKLLGCALVLLAVVRPAPAADLAPGTTLDQTTAEAAADLLSPEVLAEYRSGGYRNAIAAWPDRPPFSAAFARATAANRGRFDVDERGTIVDATTRKPAPAIYGLPFVVAPDDAAAGVKAIWNAYRSLWRVGSTDDVLALDWVGKSGLERQAVLRTKTLYYDGARPGLAPAQNPLNLAAQQDAVVTSPADLNGTASLTWRFRDADQHDQSWTYVPALRRVRQISPANRSDGFLGSDLSQDDGSFFDGKPEDFEWTLTGEREGLVLADPASLAGTVRRTADEGTGFRDEWPAGQQVIGYQDPDWHGTAWAPRAPVLVRRKLWVVSAVPRDPYYLYRRIEILLDQETFQGVASRKFDAQGALLRSLAFLLYASQPVGGDATDVLPASSMGYLAAVNVKAGRATIAGTSPPGASVHRRRVPLDPSEFALEQLGKGK